MNKFMIGGAGTDTLKAILLWIGWIVAVIAIIAVCIDWIMCKSALSTATENYTKADKVREKVLGELRTQIEEYNKLTNAGIEMKTDEDVDKNEDKKEDEQKDE